MATSGKAYAISVAIYAAVLALVFILFSVWRRLSFTKKFFAPKRFVVEEGYKPPPRLPNTLLGWLGQVVKTSEAQVISSGGIDAALYIKFLRMGVETFLVVSFIVLAIILPINITNDTIDQLMNAQAAGAPVPVSTFTYWIPPPPSPPPPSPPIAPGAAPASPSPTPSPAEDKAVEAPDFYTSDGIPPAPPGLSWEKYAPGVPPLGPAPPGYVWYYSADNVPSDYTFTDLDKTTLSNIPESSPKMVAHAVICWVICLFIFFQLWRYSKVALRLRMFYLLNTPKGAESHTVLVTDIPGVDVGTDKDGKKKKKKGKKEDSEEEDAAQKKKEDAAAAAAGTAKGTAGTAAGSEEVVTVEELTTLNSIAAGDADSPEDFKLPDRWALAVAGIKGTGSVHGMVDAEFKKVFEKEFAHSNVVNDTAKLDALVRDYESTALAARDLVDDYISKKNRKIELKPKKLTVIGAKLGPWGREKYGLKPKKVDAFEYYQDRLAFLWSEIEAAQEEAKTAVWPTAFVTFTRRTAQVVASGALVCEDLSAWRCQAAPRPPEVVWSNLRMRAWERTTRGRTMWAAFTALTLFYLIPVAAVQALLSTNSLLGFIQDIPIAASFITAILPGLVLTIFIALLPPIITAMNRFAGMVSLSQIDIGLLSRFFIFQVVTVFFGSFILGSAANQFQQLINDPGSIVTLLGTAAPQTAIFFLTYVTLRALFVIPFSILRLVPFIIFWIKSKFLASTERAKARLWQNQLFSYGTQVPGDTMVILLGTTFSCICPIIAPAALIYFCTTYVVRKHDLVWVFRQPYQTGAMTWRNMFNQSCAGLIIFQLVMICLLALKKSVAGPLIIIPLPFATLIFMNAVSSTFWRPMDSLSLLAASEIDARETLEAETAATKAAGGDLSNLYLSPSFTVDAAEHADILDDCKRMQAVLEGGTDEKLFKQETVTSDEFQELIDEGTVVKTESGAFAMAGADGATPQGIDAV